MKKLTWLGALALFITMESGMGCSSTISGNAPGVDAGDGADANVNMDAGSMDATSPDDSSTPDDSASPMDMSTVPDSSSYDAGRPEDGDYFVSPTGDDSNPGTLEMPFRTLGKLNDVLNALGAEAAGKIAYIRGGTYLSDAGDAAGVHFLLEDLHGTASNPIRIWAYPGERPIFSCANITPSNAYPFVFALVNSSYVHLKGISVTTLAQIPSGVGISRGVNIAGCDHCTIELIEVSHIAGTGFTLGTSGTGVPSTFNHILNVDSHHNGDGRADPENPEYGSWNTGDGFGNTGGDESSDNVYEGCRAWLNSDDGYDWFDWAGARVTITNCWAFWNGIKPWGMTNMDPTPAEMTPNDPSVFFGVEGYVVTFEGGEGFKLGGHGAAGPVGMPTVLKKYIDHCVSFENTGTGYSENMLAEFSHQMQFLNSIAFNNGNDGWGFGVGRSVGIAHIFRNNWAFANNRIASGGDWVYDGLPDNISNNVWASNYAGIDYGNLADVEISNDDFESVSSAGAAGPREADGSLPNLPFLHLVAGSDLIDRGTEVGYPHTGTHPDVGAYER